MILHHADGRAHRGDGRTRWRPDCSRPVLPSSATRWPLVAGRLSALGWRRRSGSRRARTCRASSRIADARGL